MSEKPPPIAEATDVFGRPTLGEADRPRRTFSEILHALPVGVEIYDRNFDAVFYNKAADDLFLYVEKPVLHHDEWWELGFPDPVARAAAIAEWRQMVALAHDQPGTAHTGEWNVRCRDGLQHIVQYRFCFLGDTYILVLLDVTEQRRLEAELRWLANVDPLTEAFNRRRFLAEAELTFATCRENGRALTLLMLDIDHFKAVNDRHGHGVGDEVIRLVARRCQEAVRAGDMLARMGGEEFAVLLPDAGPADARRVADGLLDAVTATPLQLGALNLPVGISIGGTCARPDDPHVDAVLKRADRALYTAKNAGRGRVVFDAAVLP
ncbi:GGDEF domain-containing protein [Azorhizobium doebereinerae]|uniref:GGDEF domain-containing protein n=1 Tax=Azorhizobium doebereinerae TaxID=281091 RepID=UPI0004151C0E|nr:GGDEF domain-containing protein [Azorhizobium doebereinerae]